MYPVVIVYKEKIRKTKFCFMNESISKCKSVLNIDL